MSKHKNYAFIGDIHSNVAELRKLLRKIRSLGKYTPIYLGDIFDSCLKDPEYNRPLEVLNEIKQDPDAIVLRSNHQYKLERYLKGNKLTVLERGLNNTIYGLGLEDINSEKSTMLLRWLMSLPYCLELVSHGTTYRVAHAYCPSKADLTVLNSNQRHLCLFGPTLTSVDNGKAVYKRMKWWESESNPHNYVKVAGHYHTVYYSPHAIILDGNCGVKANGFLAAYLTDRKVIVTSAEGIYSKPEGHGAFSFHCPD